MTEADHVKKCKRCRYEDNGACLYFHLACHEVYDGTGGVGCRIELTGEDWEVRVMEMEGARE